jgi:glyoxylase-like metal-dependent hydrolase (beta-lactamase superfamily II)
MEDGAERSTPAIDSAELARRARAGEEVTVIDVRDRDEFEEWHVEGAGVTAVQIPHQRFIAARVRGTTQELVTDLDPPLVVVCAVGEASAEVAAQLRDAGVEAVNLDGGMEAWAAEYDVVELPCASATVYQYRRPSSGCLAYLVVAGPDGSREAAVVDPLRAFTDRYAADAAAQDATICWILDTHVHADHVSGARDLAAETGASLVLPAGATDRGLTLDEGLNPAFVDDGDELAVGDASLNVLELPGHTPEMTGYRLRDDEYGDLLFAGDSLFLDSVARPDLAVDTADVEEMARTLHETVTSLSELPPRTRVAPGHYGESTAPDESGAYVASLATLIDRLALLSMGRTAFVERITRSMPSRPGNYERIIAVNLGRESVDDETAGELELGPNHCSVG